MTRQLLHYVNLSIATFVLSRSIAQAQTANSQTNYIGSQIYARNTFQILIKHLFSCAPAREDSRFLIWCSCCDGARMAGEHVPKINKSLAPTISPHSISTPPHESLNKKRLL